MSCLSKNLNLIKMIFDLFSRKKSDGFLSNKDIQAFFLLVLDNKSPNYFQYRIPSHICPAVGNLFQYKQTDRHSIFFHKYYLGHI